MRARGRSRRPKALLALALVATGCSTGREPGTSAQETPTAGLRSSVVTVAPEPSCSPEEVAQLERDAGYVATGFFAAQEAPFPRGAFAFNNAWQGFRGRRLVSVWAGAVYGRPARGAIAVQQAVVVRDCGVFAGTRALAKPSVHLAPRGLASLTLRRIVGNRILFTSADGRVGSFDILARTYAPG